MNCSKSIKRASYLARFAYIGSHFHGLQPNKGFVTAGGALHDLLSEAAGVPPKALQFSARTDAGVHALENYATFWFPRPFDHERFKKALPDPGQHNLLYVELTEVPFWVHARANARGKRYRYVIEDNADMSCPSLFAWSIVPELDVAAMQKAADYLVGTHAFDAFQHGGCGASSTIKTISRIHIATTKTSSAARRQIQIDIEGNAFLRRMVRIIVGTLAQIGAGLRSPDDIEDILLLGDRSSAGPSAPACGLTLMHVGFELT